MGAANSDYWAIGHRFSNCLHRICDTFKGFTARAGNQDQIRDFLHQARRQRTHVLVKGNIDLAAHAAKLTGQNAGSKKMLFALRYKNQCMQVHRGRRRCDGSAGSR